MSKDIIDKVSEEEWYRVIHISELVYTIIDYHLTQSHISKLDKDILPWNQEQYGWNRLYNTHWTAEYD